MWHFDEQTARLPPPRTEEPANLRRDIVDELSDHLTCALKREQCADAPQDNQAPQHRVLDRFGDPVAVARKLWLDALWEKIMTQRILVVACLAMAVVTCVALALGWQSMRHQQDMIATWQETSASQLREQKEHFERLLAQSAKTQAPSDWNPVEFRFVRGTADGPPMAGVRLYMTIETKESDIPPRNAVSDEQGIVRFERIRYGIYNVRVTAPSGDYTYFQITLQPGEGLTKSVVCPYPPSEPSSVNVRIAWPDDLKQAALWALFDQEHINRLVGDRHWRYPKPMFSRSDSGLWNDAIILAPDGELHSARSPQFAYRSSYERVAGERAKQQQRVSLPEGLMPALETHSEGMIWPGHDFVITRLDVLTSPSRAHSEATLPRDFAERRSPPKKRDYFYSISVDAKDWGYRIEPGADGAPGTLWLTPTAVAIETVRKSLAELDQALAKSAAPDAKEKEKATTADAPAKDAAAKDAPPKE